MCHTAVTYAAKQHAWAHIEGALAQVALFLVDFHSISSTNFEPTFQHHKFLFWFLHEIHIHEMEEINTGHLTFRVGR
jgi:hypothetical protein